MQFSNFIYERPNTLSKDVCDAMIKEGVKTLEAVDFSIGFETGAGVGDTQFRRGKLGRHDFQLNIPKFLNEFYNTVKTAVYDTLNEYANEISSIKGLVLLSDTFKWQLTPIQGGFSEWHTEQSGGFSSSRALVWMIYLNDVEEGGDTEFLYQQIKCKPEAGKMVMWPAGLTHPHRGNPPYSNEKYVVTGWLEFPTHPSADVALQAMVNNEK